MQRFQVCGLEFRVCRSQCYGYRVLYNGLTGLRVFVRFRKGLVVL